MLVLTKCYHKGLLTGSVTSKALMLVLTKCYPKGLLTGSVTSKALMLVLTKFYPKGLLTGSVTSKAICTDPPPISIIPTVFFRVCTTVSLPSL